MPASLTAHAIRCERNHLATSLRALEADRRTLPDRIITHAVRKNPASGTREQRRIVELDAAIVTARASIAARDAELRAAMIREAEETIAHASAALPDATQAAAVAAQERDNAVAAAESAERAFRGAWNSRAGLESTIADARRQIARARDARENV